MCREIYRQLARIIRIPYCIIFRLLTLLKVPDAPMQISGNLGPTVLFSSSLILAFRHSLPLPSPQMSARFASYIVQDKFTLCEVAETDG